MSKTVSISWLKQRSGNFALKGITIHEGARAYDSMGTFRDEDANWLTTMLGADPRVELSGSGTGQRSSEDYPGWALEMEEQGADSANDLPLDKERAGATILRHVLSRIIEPCSVDNATPRFKALVEEARSALAATDAGMFYTPGEVRIIFERRAQLEARIKRRPLARRSVEVGT